MKSKQAKIFAVLGGVCALAMAVSVWYSVRFNGGRLVEPMDFSSYAFRPQDLPMILSLSALTLYILCLAGWCLRAAFDTRRRAEAAHTTRALNPKLGFLGLFGFLGFGAFWTYPRDGSIFPVVFFVFFGFFGFFYEGKMSNTLMDERYEENKQKASARADALALRLILIFTVILSQGRFLGSMECALVVYLGLVCLTLALDLFLGEYLLYRYDHDELTDESEG